jgi:hypothetical protein
VKGKQESIMKYAPTCVYSLTMMTEVLCSPKMSVDFHQTTWCCITDGRTVGHVFICLLLGEGKLSFIL